MEDEQPKKKRNRKKKLVINTEIHSIRFDPKQFDLIRQIAQIQTFNTKKYVSCHQLIRDALKMVFEDNEWLRECFRRTREANTTKWFYKARKR